MPRVDFYVLEEADGDARLRLACRLAERAWSDAQPVFVLAASVEEARVFDELLWTYRDRSFVPHALADSPDAAAVRVRIGVQAAQADGGGVLINLAPAVPEDFERFERILEPLDGDRERRQQGRDRFRYYRERGVMPQSHSVGPNHEP
jgi:DNA polymerase-3 subunit chi